MVQCRRPESPQRREPRHGIRAGSGFAPGRPVLRNSPRSPGLTLPTTILGYVPGDGSYQGRYGCTRKSARPSKCRPC
ncbi:hypothetical protein ARTHRO9AX_150012 [Arthrobacter sp. 9AX]|nr:hypothetical protein ARTHRO9AX_150012 [Arthrobacter sp. 9AX]